MYITLQERLLIVFYSIVLNVILLTFFLMGLGSYLGGF